MPNYSVYMFCDACSTPHPMGIGVVLDEEIASDQSIGDIYDGRELPESIASLKDNSTICPTTGKQITQRTNFHVFLVRNA